MCAYGVFGPVSQVKSLVQALYGDRALRRQVTPSRDVCDQLAERGARKDPRQPGLLLRRPDGLTLLDNQEVADDAREQQCKRRLGILDLIVDTQRWDWQADRGTGQVEAAHRQLTGASPADNRDLIAVLPELKALIRAELQFDYRSRWDRPLLARLGLFDQAARGRATVLRVGHADGLEPVDYLHVVSGHGRWVELFKRLRNVLHSGEAHPRPPEIDLVAEHRRRHGPIFPLREEQAWRDTIPVWETLPLVRDLWH